MIPQWALLLSFWLHMLATVAWLGGLAAGNSQFPRGTTMRERLQELVRPLAAIALAGGLAVQTVVLPLAVGAQTAPAPGQSAQVGVPPPGQPPAAW